MTDKTPETAPPPQAPAPQIPPPQAPPPKPRAHKVWIVTARDGLIQAPSDRVEALTANGHGRRATARDLSIAGVTGAPEIED